MATVRQSGGDYSTLNAACAANETTIDIDSTWTANDTTKVTISTANTVITVSGGARHAGVINESTWTHHRLVCTAGHCITLDANNCTINGLVIHQDGTGASDEGVRINFSNSTATFKNCIVYGNSAYVENHDGFYAGPNVNGTLNFEQCLGYNLSRGAFHVQDHNGGTTLTTNFNSCTAVNCGASSETDSLGGGGFCIRGFTGGSKTTNMHNCVAVKNTGNVNAKDVNLNGSGLTTNVSNSVYGTLGTGTITSGSNNLSARTATDSSSPGAGDWIVFENITTYPFNWKLKSNAENDAQDRHANATAHSLTIPSTDIVGTARPQNTNYDVGAFEILAAIETSLIAQTKHQHFSRLLRF